MELVIGGVLFWLVVYVIVVQAGHRIRRSNERRYRKFFEED